MTDTFTPVEIQHRAFWHALLSQIIDPTNRPNPGKVPTALMDTTSYLWSTPHCPRRVIGTFDPHFTVRASLIVAMGTTDTPFVLNTLRADQMTHPDAAHTVLTPTWTKSAVGNITLMRTSTTRDKAYEVNAHNFLHKDAVTNHVRLRLMTWLRTLDDNATTSQP